MPGEFDFVLQLLGQAAQAGSQGIQQQADRARQDQLVQQQFAREDAIRKEGRQQSLDDQSRGERNAAMQALTQELAGLNPNDPEDVPYINKITRKSDRW